MKRNNFWRLTAVLFLLAWSINELYPPTGKDLIAEFERRGANKDTNFTAIVARARELQARLPARTFGNLFEAVGTNDISRYFTNSINVSAEIDPTRAILNRIQKDAAGKIRLGLDLQGGTSFLVVLDTKKLGQNPEATNTTSSATNTNATAKATITNPTNTFASITDIKGARDHAIEVLRRRIDRFGVAEPILQPAGDDRILIMMPGLSEEDKKSARVAIEKPAYLEFRMVHTDSQRLMAEGLVPPGYEILRQKNRGQDNKEVVIPMLVKIKPERGLTGAYVERARASSDAMTGRPEILFKFNSEGAKTFGDITTEHVHHHLGIVLDGDLKSAPVINEPIRGGNGVIHGDFTVKEAIELATTLENPLQAPVHIEEEDSVDPTLGVASIKSGVLASFVGTVAVAGFMLVYYLLAGVIANVALMLNIVILLGVMCNFGTTLTLPGIAGIVLTIGMAVDANVLIYERIREELAAAKSMRGALAAGYDKAFGTIFDSNLTTLIASVLLIYLGTGPIRGFGVTLTIGITVSMFTALVVTRLIFDWLLAKGRLNSLRMWQFPFLHGTRWDFMKFAKPAFALSWAIILVGCAYGLYRGKEMLSVDFAGGDATTYTFEKKIEPDALSKVVREVTVDGKKIGDAMIQYEKNISDNTEKLRITSPVGTSVVVEKELKGKFPEAKLEVKQSRSVGPTVGKEIQRSAITATVLALFGILVYVAFRYEFSFAVGAVVAVIHDVLMTVGWYCLTGLWGEGRQFNATFVAAILTIIGFSINDTIVIFDRIREDLKLGLRGTFSELINQALNQTLSRTIITSGTVFLATTALYLLGGGPINDFAFTFLVGIITGTYSSIYIASALVLWWHKGERPKSGGNVTMDNAAPPKTASARA
jgi:SecD/SecF fusion protein